VCGISLAQDGRIFLDVAWTKPIVMTGGLIKALGDLSSQRLTEWLNESGLIHKPDAFIFGPVHLTNCATAVTLKPLSTRALEDIFARAWREAGSGQDAPPNKNRYRGWSGQSTRVGAAVDMATKNIALRKLCRKVRGRNQKR